MFVFKTTYQGLKNCLHAPVCVHNMYAKALDGTQKNVHANFEYLFISKILEKDFTEIFCHCFIETSFVVHF